MITINIMLIFKILSLIFLGIFMIITFISSFNNKNSIISMIICFIMFGLPFAYILIN